MCGIYGSSGRVVNNPDFINSVNKSLHHRGPDFFDYHFNSKDRIFFSHARLSIIDTSMTGHQPMFDPISKNLIIFNGEIYNYISLKKELISLGLKFKGTSDTEVILLGYREWGINVIKKLTGMFAFAIWDNTKKQTILARDRLGEKPLYFHHDVGKSFVFSSNLKTILINNFIPIEINHNDLPDYFYKGYVDGDKSIISNIKKLNPGHYLIIQNNKIIEETDYWNLSQFFKNKKKYHTENEIFDELNSILEPSIKNQIEASDVPVGVFLSSGVDSSLVSIIANQFNKNIQSFTAGFIDQRFSEVELAKQIANKFKIKNKDFLIDELKFEDIIEPFNHIDEPFGDTSLIPTFYLSRYTKNYTKVILSGDGGDELFLGYETYKANKIYQLFKYIPKSLIKLLRKGLSKIDTNQGKVDVIYKLKAFTNGLHFDFRRAHESWREIFNINEVIKLLGISKEKSLSNHWDDIKNCHYLDQASYIDIKTWLPNDILFKVDRMSMANSQETRSPLLNHKLVEFAACLPIKYKMKLFESKYVLKKYLKKKYKLKFGKKLGFTPPASNWITSHHAKLNEYLETSNLINVHFLGDLFQEHLKKNEDNSYKIFTILGYCKWIENVKNIKQMRSSL
jgi:asparagine synthase (glutamine-hydrolysing)